MHGGGGGIVTDILNVKDHFVCICIITLNRIPNSHSPVCLSIVSLHVLKFKQYSSSWEVHVTTCTAPG